MVKLFGQPRAFGNLLFHSHLYFENFFVAFARLWKCLVQMKSLASGKYFLIRQQKLDIFPDQGKMSLLFINTLDTFCPIIKCLC